MPTLLTYIVSSIWHGSDAGYFLFFIGLAFVDILGRIMASTALAHKISSIVNAKILFVILWVWNFFALSYLGMGFLFLEYRKFNVVHASVGHIIHYLIPVGIVIAMLLPKYRKPKQTATSADTTIPSKTETKKDK